MYNNFCSYTNRIIRLGLMTCFCLTLLLTIACNNSEEKANMAQILEEAQHECPMNFFSNMNYHE